MSDDMVELDNATNEQIVRANAAVQANLNSDGLPKYESAFGYACALTAIMQSDDALHVREMRTALEECQDKLWVIHFNLPDASEREAALNACNMATKALALFTPQPEASDDPA